MQRSFDDDHKAGRHGGDQCHQSDPGISAVTVSINNSTLSQNVTLSLMSGRHRSRIWWSLRMVQGGRFDGEHAACEGNRCIRKSLAGQTVSVLADNGATVSPTSSQGRTVRWRSLSPARRRGSYSHRNHQQQQSEPGCDIYRHVRTAQIADLVVIKDGSEADVRRRTRCGLG